MVSAEEVLEMHKPAEAKTYGILLVQDAIGISLVGEFFPETNEYRGRTFIPAGMIQAVEVLKVGRNRLPRQKPKHAHAKAKTEQGQSLQLEGDTRPHGDGNANAADDKE